MNSSSGDDGTEHVLDPANRAVTLVFVGVEVSLALVALLQLARLHVVSRQSGTPFLGKKVYHALLFLTVAFRAADHGIRGLSPCYNEPFGFRMWCFSVRKVLQHVGGTFTLLMFGQAMIYWADYVRFLASGGRVVDALLRKHKIGLGIAAGIYTALMVLSCVLTLTLAAAAASAISAVASVVQSLGLLGIGIGLGVYAVWQTVLSWKLLPAIVRPKALLAGVLSTVCAAMLVAGPVYLAAMYIPMQFSNVATSSSAVVSGVVMALQSLPCIIITVVMWPLPQQQSSSRSSLLLRQRLVTTDFGSAAEDDDDDEDEVAEPVPVEATEGNPKPATENPSATIAP